jgi:hypothetical protein
MEKLADQVVSQVFADRNRKALFLCSHDHLAFGRIPLRNPLVFENGALPALKYEDTCKEWILAPIGNTK